MIRRSARSTLFPYTTLFRSEADIVAAYRLGANGYLVKPPDLGKLLDMAKSIKDFWLMQNTPPQETPGKRSEEHTSELQSQSNLVCRLLLEKKNNTTPTKNDH